MTVLRSDGGRSIGRYVLFEPIAKGGMAAVHLGRLMGSVGFARTVAIKRLHDQFATDPDFAAMFVDEARLASRIRHPNVVQTLDVIAEGGEVLLVLEYVHGESLAKLLRAARAKREAVPLRVGLHILTDLLNGLHAAHEAKNEAGHALSLVHRDISPQNVLVGADGVARILDFGVAKAAHRLHETTSDGRLKGKLAYMAPEQLQSQPIDRRTDVFAASIVAWELLTGRRLFGAEEAGTVVTQVLSAKIPPPSRMVPTLPRALDEIVLRGLAKEPAQRFQTAEAMALELERVSRHASAREVGVWVSSLASTVLDERSARIAAIEGATRSDGAPPAQGATNAAPLRVLAESGGSGSGSGQLLPSEPAIASNVTNLSHAASLTPAPRRPLRLALGAVAALLLVGAGALGMRWVGKDSRANAASAGPAPVPSSLEPPTAPSAQAPSPPVPPVVSAQPAASETPPAGSAPTNLAKPGGEKRPTPSTAVKSPPAQPKGKCTVPASCKPPWIIDATGTKKFKPECAAYLNCTD